MEKNDIVAIVIVIFTYIALPLLLLSLITVVYLTVSCFFKLFHRNAKNILEFFIYLFLSIVLFVLTLLITKWHKKENSLFFIGEKG